ncbi:MAG: DUF4019 domain-containing protein [Deltaproteobacteria bacterium]|nr:DUF4019 domain-containing protein [Deltaproteobacteria bacterium]
MPPDPDDDDDESAAPKADPASSGSGSIDVQLSAPNLTAAPKADAPPGSSGSIDVQFSQPHLAKASDGTPERVSELDSAPVASGRMTGVVATATATATETTRTKRIADVAKHALDEGVTAIGSGLETIGENVQKLGEKSRRVPLVGANITKLGEGIASVGESLTELPRVARTRSGRLLFRSLIVGFAIVASWITIIVAVQIRGTDAPDFRPLAEQILIQLSNSSYDELYEKSSPRFQEVVRKERFVDEMSDMQATVGKFREITAVNDTLVTTGPTGRVGRLSLTVAFDKGTCKSSVSFHWDDGTWKLLGVGVELPPELRPTAEQREARVIPPTCADPMSKKCELKIVANAILEKLRDGKAGEVYDEASDVFQKEGDRGRFVQIQTEHAVVLGEFRRILAVTEAIQTDGHTRATFDALLEYANALAVRAVFTFERPLGTHAWRLRSFKRVLPMPRLDDVKLGKSVPGTLSPLRPGLGSGGRPPAGSGSAGSGSARR